MKPLKILGDNISHATTIILDGTTISLPNGNGRSTDKYQPLILIIIRIYNIRKLKISDDILNE